MVEYHRVIEMCLIIEERLESMLTSMSTEMSLQTPRG